MTTSVWKLKSRYSQEGVKVYRPLCESVAKSLSIFLLVVFLLGHAFSAWAGLQGKHWSGTPSGVAEFATDAQYELQSENVNSREFRNVREKTESYSLPKLELKNHCQLSIADNSVVSVSPQFLSRRPLRDRASICEAPFSPRPPPATLLLQG